MLPWNFMHGVADGRIDAVMPKAVTGVLKLLTPSPQTSAEMW